MKYLLKQDGDLCLVFQSKAKYTPFVVCHYFNKDTQSWSWGNYFKDLDSAMKFFKEKANAK